MSEMKNNIVVVNLAKVELPDFKENPRNEWVNFGEDNNFPAKLVDLSNKSAMHNAIIVSKVDNVYGKGLSYDGVEDKKTEQFLKSANPTESMNDILKKIDYDFVLYGGYYLNVIWSKDKKTIAETYHLDFNKVRASKKDEKGQINSYWYSENWLETRKEGNKPREIPVFDPNKPGGSTILAVKEYRPGTFYYPLPSYIAALSYIETDSEIANFHLAHILNGMQPNVIINFTNGIPTEEERRVIERQISAKYVGSDNAGKFILSFSEDKDKVPIVERLSADEMDKAFIQLQDTVLQNILSGHRIVSPMLVGLKTEGQLGGATELLNAFSIYNNTVITPIKNVVLKTINELGKINKAQELTITTIAPVEFQWTETVLSKILSVDEMREKIGLEPLQPDKVMAPITPITQITIPQ